MAPDSDPSCVFCLIVAGALPATVVHEDTDTLAFRDINPVTEGHTLVIPRRHSRTVLDIEPADAAAVMTSAVAVSRLLDDVLHPDGFTLFQANEPAGWQTVFHFHVHVVPRWHDDVVKPPWVHPALTA